MRPKKVEIPESLLEDKEENYSAVFDLVKNPKDWRTEVLVRVPEAAESVVNSAIIYYTATHGNVSNRKDGWVTIFAEGYRMGPAGP